MLVRHIRKKQHLQVARLVSVAKAAVAGRLRRVPKCR